MYSRLAESYNIECTSPRLESGGRPKILLVEENYEQRALLSTMLEREKFRVVAVPTAKAALSNLRLEHFTCLISDASISDCDGWNFLWRIRHEQSLETIPIIVLTSKAFEWNSPVDANKDNVYCLKKGAKKHLATHLRKLLNSMRDSLQPTVVNH